MDRLGLANTDLREFLSNKWKLHSKELVHISSFQFGQVGCQFDGPLHPLLFGANPRNVSFKLAIGV